MTESYQKTILDNGIRVVSEKMNYGHSVSIGVWLVSGSRYETVKQNGVSHLLEHMLFKGTPSRSAYDIAISLESLGGHLNAFTEKEFTCYYAFILDENVSEALEVIADIIQNGVLAEEDLKNEKRIVFEEIQNIEDTPEDWIHDCFCQTVYGQHDMGLPILGSKESLQRITRSDLVEYKDQCYTSNNIIVAAAGQVEHHHLVDFVSNLYHSCNPGPPISVTPIQLNGSEHKNIQSPIQQAHICTGSVGLSFNDNQKYALISINSILGGGMSSRLFQNLREKRGLAYSVYSFLECWSDTGLLGVYAGTSKQNIENITDLIDNEFNSLCDQGLPQEELDRTKSQLTRSLILGMEDSTSRMNRLAKREIYTRSYQSIDETISLIDKVTLHDVNVLSNEIFKAGERYTTIIEPEKRPNSVVSKGL